jgi:hypothetical protein
MSKVASETRIAERFADWLSKETGQRHSVTRAPNPPDFLLSTGTWLELSNIYLNDEEAEFCNSPKEKTLSGICSPDQLALRLLQKLDEKLAKKSYQEIYQQRGKGILLLTCQDLLFDQVNLAHIQKHLKSFRPTDDQGFFKVAYFEHQLAGARFYDPIYPRAACRDWDQDPA